MLIFLHKQATMTPKIGAVAQANKDQIWMIAEHEGKLDRKVLKWRKLESIHASWLDLAEDTATSGLPCPNWYARHDDILREVVREA